MITLRPWSANDRLVLDRTVGDATMMEHLGGAEDAAALDVRHARYLAIDSTHGGVMFTIAHGPTFTTVGTTGYWERSWRDEDVYETGWQVFPEFAGQGIATQAARAILAILREKQKLRTVHAFPSIDNVPSNRVCARANFTNLGSCEYEYPKGRLMRSNDWCYVLERARR